MECISGLLLQHELPLLHEAHQLFEALHDGLPGTTAPQ